MIIFFGGVRVDEESNETYGRISFETRFRESETAKISTRQRIRFNLPGTEKKLKLIFDKEGLDEDRGGLLTPQVPNQENEEGFDTALRYVVQRKAKLNTQFDGGLRVRAHRPFNFFARLRNRFSWETSDVFELRFVSELYHFVRTYGRADTRVDFDFSLRDDSLIRFGNFARWEDRKDFFEFSNSLSYFMEISDKRALGFHFVASGDNEIKTNLYKLFIFYAV